MSAVFIDNHEQQEIFEQAFYIFWRNPKMMEKLMGAMLPTIRVDNQDEVEEMNRRLADAMGDAVNKVHDAPQETQIELDATLTYSSREAFMAKDFEAMSLAEINQAKQAIAELRLPVSDVPTRRFRRSNRGRHLDMRATLRASLRSVDTIPLKLKTHQLRRPPIVLLCDISGSMSRYSRMFLHFMHGVINHRDRAHAFVFATRLTNITRSLKNSDIDAALERVSTTVEDFSSGTRIGECLKQFNVEWSRRVLAQGAITVIISDGLDKDAAAGLEQQMQRLAKSSRRLIWLNPLLRYEGFEPRPQGIQAMLPHVDDFKSAHNLNSIVELVRLLSEPAAQGALAGRSREVA
jgi:uncharacterized protein with von Willebrand factor type A (vWA) domain